MRSWFGRGAALWVAAALCFPVIATSASRGAAAAPLQADAEQLFREAVDRQSAGQLRAALDSFGELVDRYPPEEFPELRWRAVARVRIGEIRLRLGQASAAASAFVAALDDEPVFDQTPRARLGLATSMRWSGEWQAAASLLQRIINDAESGDAVDPAVTPIARRHLSLLHRLWVRPTSGMLPWQRARLMELQGQELDDPIGIAASDDGTLLVADEGADRVFLVERTGRVGSIEVDDLRRPWWDADSIAYVAAKDHVLMPLRGETVAFSWPDRDRSRAVEDIRAGARTGAGEWVLLDWKTKKVMGFGPDGAYRFQLATGEDTEPLDLARDGLGRFYIIDKKTRTIAQFAPDGSRLGGISVDSWEKPEALALDGLGYLYVLDRDEKRIDVVDPQWVVRWSLGPLLPGGIELRDPRDLSVDGSGRIYVADRSHSTVVAIE